MDSDQEKTPAPGNNIDLGKILLPKKETGPSPLSAQRVNAGALLAQEEKAAEPTPKPAASVPPPPAPKKEESQVKAIETYTSDISRVIRSGEMSAVSIAAAQADHHEKTATKDEVIAPPELSQEEKTSRWRIVLIIVGILLIVAALGTVAVVITRSLPQPLTNSTTVEAPFMSVDQTIPVVITADTTRDVLMTSLEATREQVSLPVGLVAQLYVGMSTTSSSVPEYVPAAQLLGLLAPDIPQDLLRTISPTYLLGVHSYDENQAFLVLHVDSYQQAYSGMLAWEPTVQRELAPLFTRNPSPHLPTQTSDASSTASTSTVQFLQTGFVDKVVENHDTRAVVNSTGDLLLLWTFLDRNTIVITTNDYALREVIRRLNTASLVPQPQ